LDPKTRAIPEETRQKAVKTFYMGVSGRGVGKVLGMSKANVYNWIKKTDPKPKNEQMCYELDELYWFIERKAHTQTRENVYLMTMVSRNPRNIAGFDVAYDKSPERIQAIVDSAPEAEKYCTDGYLGYIDVVYPGEHVRNIHNKSDTFTVEGVNADLRHYIPILARRSRCFARKIETLRAVVEVFVEAYNKFGVAKMKFRHGRDPKSRELPFSVLDFL
jgi:IS1 family transposase